MRGVRPAVLVMLSFAVEAASAGPLVAASYSQIVAGARFDAAALAPSGTLVGNTFTLDPGSAFATTGCVAGIGNPFGCTETASGSFPRHVLRFDYQIGGNGALTATTGQATITPTRGISGHVTAIGRLTTLPTHLPPLPFFFLDVQAGERATHTTAGTVGSYSIEWKKDAWHLGAVTQTGLTLGGQTVADERATGNVSVTPGGTTITLVSLGRIKSRGAFGTRETATLGILKLFYAQTVPEPGVLALLGAGTLGLMALGCRKGDDRRRAISRRRD